MDEIFTALVVIYPWYCPWLEGNDIDFCFIDYVFSLTVEVKEMGFLKYLCEIFYTEASQNH